MKLNTRLLSLAVVCTFLMGCAGADLQRVKEVSSGAGRIMIGDNWKQVVSALGDPNEFEQFENNALFKYCATGDTSTGGDPMVYIWLRDGTVQNVYQEYNLKSGYCTDFFRSVNWRESLSNNQISLIGPAPESFADYQQRRADNSRVLSEALENSYQQNNQIYNSLIESMGQQQRSLQPQRFQTNCTTIGNFTSCY